MLNSDIGQMGAYAGNDILQDRLIQGGSGSVFTIDNCNVTYSSGYYYGLDNFYENVYVDGNYWDTDDDLEVGYVFSDVYKALNWGNRADSEIDDNGAPTLKIAAPTPLELARYNESVGDFVNAKKNILNQLLNPMIPCSINVR